MSSRLEELKQVNGGTLSEEDAIRLFDQELSKSVENKDSALWTWLTRVS